MHKSLLVRIMQGVTYGRHQFGGFPIFESLLLQLRGEVGPFDVFRDDVARAIVRAADIMHRDYGGMVQIGDRTSHSQIGFGIFWLGNQLGVRNLDGDRAVQ